MSSNRARAMLTWIQNTTRRQQSQDAWITTGTTSRPDRQAYIVWPLSTGTMPRHLQLPCYERTTCETITQGVRLQMIRDLIDSAAL